MTPRRQHLLCSKCCWSRKARDLIHRLPGGGTKEGQAHRGIDSLRCRHQAGSQSRLAPGLAAWCLLHVHCDSVVAAASEPTNQGLLPLISRRVRCAFERTQSSAEEGASKSATHPLAAESWYLQGQREHNSCLLSLIVPGSYCQSIPNPTVCIVAKHRALCQNFTQIKHRSTGYAANWLFITHSDWCAQRSSGACGRSSWATGDR
jgi:hypothetical protein